MPDLNFTVTVAEIVPYAASPLLNLRLQITDAENRHRIESVILRCQIRLEVTRRSYTEEEKARLFELFGEPERWGQTLRTMLWTHASATVPPFTEHVEVDLPVACTFDFNVAATKYFAGLDDGEIPLCLLFSGTVFYRTADGALQAEQISWQKEAYFRFPVKVWREMMEHYYPNSNWLNLGRDAFEKLRRYKTENFIPTWEQAIESLLSQAREKNSGGEAPEIAGQEIQMQPERGHPAREI